MSRKEESNRAMIRINLRSILSFAAAVLLVVAAAFTVTRTRLEAQPRGKAVYDKHCTECHGTAGKGDGPSAFYVAPRPRDFSTGRYKIRSTETGSVPTDDDLIRSVRQGLYGTAMPAWDRILSDTDLQDVVAYIKSMSPQFATPPKVAEPGEGTPSSPDSISRGQQVYEKLQCGKCHGTDGRGTGAVTTEFQDDWQQPLPAADLTQPWSFRGGATSRDIYLRFRTGMAGTPMPSFIEAASDKEMWDLANYIVSLGRKPVWSMTAQEVADHYARQEAEAKANPVKRGEYLVNTLGCVLCHSPIDQERRMLPGKRLAGGVLFRIEPYGDFPTGNLTSDKETGLGNWTDDEIKRALTKGTLRNGTRLLPFPMDWASFGTMKPSDIDAIVAYLRTVPPVSNRVPAPTFKFFPSYMWGKFKLLILGGDPPMAIFPGNAGAAGGQR
jgi:cytochrome c oxidase cbb3-type subunit 2